MATVKQTPTTGAVVREFVPLYQFDVTKEDGTLFASYKPGRVCR